MRPQTSLLCILLYLSAVICLCSSNFCQGQQVASQFPVPSNLDWRSLPPQSALEVTGFIRQQTEGNYEQIRTWEATYAKRERSYASEEEMSEAFETKLTGTVIEEFNSTMRIVIDMDAPAVFRSEPNIKLKFMKEGSNEEIKGSLVKPVAWNSIVTAEQFIHFDSKSRWPNGVSDLPNNPKTFNKRVAFREPVKKAERMELGNLMDPRDFFKFGGMKAFWDDMTDYQNLVKNESDKQKVERICKIEEAVIAGAKWYRETWKAGFYYTIIWNPHYGYHPQSHICTRDPEGKDIMSSTEWNWKTVDNIYVPSYVKQRSSRRPDGKFGYEREVKMLDCILNRPLDSHQFDYAALGLEDGDIIVDKIENIVYLWGNGQPEKLGIVGEKYEPPVSESVKGGTTRKWLFVAANVAVLTLFIAYALYRFLHKRPKTA